MSQPRPFPLPRCSLPLAELLQLWWPHGIVRVQRPGSFRQFRVRVQEQHVLVPGVLLAGERCLGLRRRAQRRCRYSGRFGRVLVVLSRRRARCEGRVLPRHSWVLRVSLKVATSGDCAFEPTTGMQGSTPLSPVCQASPLK